MAKRTQPKPKPKAELPATGYVRLTILLRLIPFSRATVWRKVKAGEFPRPVKLSSNITGFKVEDVRAWMAAQDAKGESA